MSVPTADLVAGVRRQGVQLRENDGQIQVRDPLQALTAECRQMLRQRNGEILYLLREEQRAKRRAEESLDRLAAEGVVPADWLPVLKAFEPAAVRFLLAERVSGAL